MSDAKLLFKVELVDGKPLVTLGTGHVALLSLALQCADLEVKNQIMAQDEQETLKPVILTRESDIKIPNGLLSKL